jgi:hypothetical protein
MLTIWTTIICPGCSRDTMYVVIHVLQSLITQNTMGLVNIVLEQHSNTSW